MEKGKDYKPYVDAIQSPRELTVTSIITGVILAVVFGGANAYLGLRVGMTISASIPAAVVSMGVIRVILKRDSILENNMVQTIGSAGESLAAGAIFTLPVLFMWAADGMGITPSFWQISVISFCGGVLGVMFMIPLRNALIVKEHGVLPYPEGEACAEVLSAGETGGEKAKIVFSGLGISSLYKFLTDGLRLFPSRIDYPVPYYKGAGVGADILPALAGVGFICGKDVASYLLSGGVLGWLVCMPLIAVFGGETVIFPADSTVSQMLSDEYGYWGIWENYIRYIGAGAVACGGIVSLLKSLPLIINTFKTNIFTKTAKNEQRTDKDISISVVLAICLTVALIMWLLPAIPLNLFGAIICIVFGFLFAAVSARMVGLIGASNNPVSGMAIATLLIATFILKYTSGETIENMIGAIAIGSVICIIVAMAGDTSQDLKTGYLVGATPLKQQIGEIIGTIVSAFAIGGVLYLLNKAWGFGSTELPAPQATLMKMVVEGVMQGNIPWMLVFTGVFIALAVDVVKIPVLPFAVGLYLPIHLSVPIMAGALVRSYTDKKGVSADGVLYSSGLIAGEGIVGIILAILALVSFNGVAVSDLINLNNYGIDLGDVGGIVSFVLILASIGFFTRRKTKNT